MQRCGMGFIFRKSVRLGPIRINFSKSGIGISTGVPGLRVGRGANGRKQLSVGLPGSGVSWRKTSAAGKSGGCLIMLFVLAMGSVLLGVLL